MENWKVISRSVAVLLTAVLCVTADAQQVPVLSKSAQAIKRKADGLTPSSPISVVPVHGEEEFGEFISRDQESLTFHDIDRKIDVTFKYSEIRKLKSGYGGPSASGRHTDRKKAIVIAVIVVGVLGALIAAAAAARN